MKARWLTLLIVFIGLSAMLAWSVTAQGRGAAGPIAATDTEQSGNLEADPSQYYGQASLTFRYVGMFGKSEQPYAADAAHLNRPAGVAIDAAGNLWVAERLGARVLKYDPVGHFLIQIGVPGMTEVVDNAHMGAPMDVAVDSRNGNVWVVDSAWARVVKYAPDGTYLSQLGVTAQAGSDNGHFSGPTSVALDAGGNVYVSDTGNHRIQIFRETGSYSATLGVTGMPGSDSSHFNHPSHIALDSDAVLYVADTDNHRVQIFNAKRLWAGTLGASGAPGQDNDHLNRPTGVIAGGGYIYVADTGNRRVQKYRTINRDYVGTLGPFSSPVDVAMDANGNVYVADETNSCVRKFSAGLVEAPSVGNCGEPYAEEPGYYNAPLGVAVDSNGNVGIVEGLGQRFIELDNRGVELHMLGQAGVPGSDNEHLSQPHGVAFDALGSIYIADSGNQRVQILNSACAYSETRGSPPASPNYLFALPVDVAVDVNGSLYVVDRDNHCVQIYHPDGTWHATRGETGVPGSDNEHFRYPEGLGLDAGCNLYVADTGNERVLKFSPDGALLMALNRSRTRGAAFDQFSQPTDVAVDADGNIYVADSQNARVQVFDLHGAYVTTIGGVRGGFIGQLRGVYRVAVDDAGKVYVADRGNHRIQMFVRGVPGWQQANFNGFGDTQNRAVSAMAAYSEQLFAGTVSSAGAGAWRLSGPTWEQVMNGFGDPAICFVDCFAGFDGYLYATVSAATQCGLVGAQIWRSANGDGPSWHHVVTDGFGDPGNGAVSSLAVFGGYLYAGTARCDAGHGAEIWRSSSGNSGSWTPVLQGTLLGNSNKSVVALETFKEALFAATHNESQGAEIWRSGEGTSWARVSCCGFGDKNNYAILGLRAFNGYLYAGTYNRQGGCAIWRSADGRTWTRVANSGLGNPNNIGIAALIPFDNGLYAVVANEVSGPEVHRSFTGEPGSWEKVADNGFGGGGAAAVYFGNCVATVAEHALYVGTATEGNGGARIWARDEAIVGLSAHNSSPVALREPTYLTAEVTAGGSVSFLWDLDAGITATGRTVTHVYTSTGHYTPTVTASNSVSLMTASTVVTVQERIEGLGIEPHGPVKLGEGLTLCATVTAGSDIVYAWDFGDQTPEQPERCATHTYTSTGTFMATVKAHNALGTIYSVSTQVIVQGAIAGLVATNNGPTRIGEPTTLCATARGTDVSYEWHPYPNVTLPGQCVTYAYTLPGAHDAVVVASNLVSRATATTTVQVDEPISWVSIATDAPTRLGTNTHLTATADGSRVNYDWDLGDGTRAGGAWVTHHYAITGTYHVVVTATNFVSSVITSTSVLVQEGIAGLQVQINRDRICVGETTWLSASTTAGDAVQFDWDLGDGTHETGPYVTHVYTVPETYCPKVTAHNQVSRPEASICVDVVEPIADLGIEHRDPGPRGRPIEFHTTGKGTHMTCVWKFGDEPEEPGGLETSHTFMRNGTYTVTVSAINYCTSPTVTAMSTIMIMEPIAAVTLTNSSPTRADRPVFFTATIEPVLPATYTWDFGGGVTMTTATGRIQHTYGAIGACLASPACTARVTVSNEVSEVSASTTVAIIPVKWTYLPIILRRSLLRPPPQ